MNRRGPPCAVIRGGAHPDDISSLLIGLLLAAFLGILASAAVAGSMLRGGDRSSPIMALGARTAPPAAFIDFCIREPGECGLSAEAVNTGEAQAALYRRYFWEPTFAARPEAIDVSEARTVPLTREALDQLYEVNRTINRSVAPTPDILAYHEGDYWTLPLSRGTEMGDCEEYALEKRHALALLNWPSQAMSLAVVTTPQGLHVVLLVLTSGGDLVLDSLSERVVGWRSVGYRWIKRQVPGRPLIWATVPDQQNG